MTFTPPRAFLRASDIPDLPYLGGPEDRLGDAYRNFHDRAWGEIVWLLKPGGTFILNVSDHIRGKEVVDVTGWHLDTLRRLGLELSRQISVPTPRMRFGANRSARVDHETVAVFVKP